MWSGVQWQCIQVLFSVAVLVTRRCSAGPGMLKTDAGEATFANFTARTGLLATSGVLRRATAMVAHCAPLLPRNWCCLDASLFVEPHNHLMVRKSFNLRGEHSHSQDEKRIVCRFAACLSWNATHCLGTEASTAKSLFDHMTCACHGVQVAWMAMNSWFLQGECLLLVASTKETLICHFACLSSDATHCSEGVNNQTIHMNQPAAHARVCELLKWQQTVSTVKEMPICHFACLSRDATHCAGGVNCQIVVLARCAVSTSWAHDGILQFVVHHSFPHQCLFCNVMSFQFWPKKLSLLCCFLLTKIWCHALFRMAQIKQAHAEDGVAKAPSTALVKSMDVVGSPVAAWTSKKQTQKHPPKEAVVFASCESSTALKESSSGALVPTQREQFRAVAEDHFSAGARRMTTTFCQHLPTELGFEKPWATPHLFTPENMTFAIAAEAGADLSGFTSNQEQQIWMVLRKAGAVNVGTKNESYEHIILMRAAKRAVNIGMQNETTWKLAKRGLVKDIHFGPCFLQTATLSWSIAACKVKMSSGSKTARQGNCKEVTMELAGHSKSGKEQQPCNCWRPAKNLLCFS